MAMFWGSCIGWYIIGTVLFLIPFSLAAAELATMRAYRDSPGAWTGADLYSRRPDRHTATGCIRIERMKKSMAAGYFFYYRAIFGTKFTFPEYPQISPVEITRNRGFLRSSFLVVSRRALNLYSLIRLDFM
jgi:hypothetical protein